jgi:RecA-family ATPase
MIDNPTFVTLSSIKPQEIRWLCKPFIPFSMFTILEGDPGLGKFFFSMFLASVISRGGNLPNGAKVRQGNVLYISAEDDPATPRDRA